MVREPGYPVTLAWVFVGRPVIICLSIGELVVVLVGPCSRVANVLPVVIATVIVTFVVLVVVSLISVAVPISGVVPIFPVVVSCVISVVVSSVVSIVVRVVVILTCVSFISVVVPLVM